VIVFSESAGDDKPLFFKYSLTPSLRLTFLTLLMIYLIGGIAVSVGRYQTHRSVAATQLTNLVDIYTENTLLTVTSLESIMGALREEFLFGLRGEDLIANLNTTASQLPQLRTLLVIDANGFVIGDSRPDQPALGINAADRAYFVVHANKPSYGIYADEPVQSRVDAGLTHEDCV
jgi:hypothetical protein